MKKKRREIEKPLETDVLLWGWRERVKSGNGESIHGFYLQMGKEYLKGRGCGTCQESLLRERESVVIIDWYSEVSVYG